MAPKHLLLVLSQFFVKHFQGTALHRGHYNSRLLHPFGVNKPDFSKAASATF